MRANRGFSLVELLIVVVVIGIVVAIAVPNLLASRRAANEGSAISALRTLHGAQMTYLTSVGGGSYAPDLASLNAVVIIDASLSSGTKAGYNFTITAIPPTMTSWSTFSASAAPVSPSGVTQTGTRNYCVRTEGIIYAQEDPALIGTQIAYNECVAGGPAIVALR